MYVNFQTPVKSQISLNVIRTKTKSNNDNKGKKEKLKKFSLISSPTALWHHNKTNIAEKSHFKSFQVVTEFNRNYLGFVSKTAQANVLLIRHIGKFGFSDIEKTDQSFLWVLLTPQFCFNR